MGLTGECSCGLVKYAIHGTIQRTRSCHCSRCRRAFGGAASAVAFIDSEDFAWTAGEQSLKLYDVAPGFGVHFCGTCSSKLAVLVDGRVSRVTLGTLDQDEGITLDEHVHVGSKAAWDDMDGETQRYQGDPPGPLGE